MMRASVTPLSDFCFGDQVPQVRHGLRLGVKVGFCDTQEGEEKKWQNREVHVVWHRNERLCDWRQLKNNIAMMAETVHHGDETPSSFVQTKVVIPS